MTSLYRPSRRPAPRLPPVKPPKAEVSFASIATSLDRIATAFVDGACEPHRFTLGVHVTHVYGRRRTTMANFVIPKLLDTESIMISCAPQKPNGDPATPTITVTSSDPAQVGVEPQPDGVSFLLLTPLKSGSATITVSATGFESDSGLLEYAEGVPGKLNTSVGNPIPD